MNSNTIINNNNNTKTTKKIDMGAASNFGKNSINKQNNNGVDFGIINSPTHRNTHHVEDLFATSPSNENHKNININVVFKTCSLPPKLDASALPDDDDFNPRSNDNNEFGNFESAFGGATAASSTATNSQKADEFADFASASFVPAPAIVPAASPLANNNDDLLFGNNINMSLFAAPSTISSVKPVTPQPSQSISADLLTDFGGLSVNSNGEFKSL